MNESHKLNVSAALAATIVGLILVFAKLWALGETSSLSVAASLADSGMDMLISMAGLGAIIYASKPADDDHAFGHSSAEDLAALGQSVFVGVVAIAIAVAAIGRFLNSDPVEITSEGRGIIVMAISIVLTLVLVLWQSRVARKTGNQVVRADRLHYVADLLPNLGAILSLWASARFGIVSIDSVVGLAAAAMLLVGALRIGKPAWDALMDRAAPAEMIRGIEEIAGNWPEVHGFHDLKTRMAGSQVFVNLHIELDGNQSLDRAHGIGAGLRHAIREKYPNTDVIIHKDPVR